MSRTIDRRTFLGSTGALAGAFMLSGASPVLAAVRAPGNSASTLVEIGGEFMPGEWLDGGNPVATVASNAISSTAGANVFPQKMHGPTRFEDLEVAVPLFRWKILWPWAQAIALGKSPRINASMAVIDAQGNTLHHLAISNAMATELRFPKADALSKDRAMMVLKLAGERFQFLPSSRPPVSRVPQQQMSLSSNFILQIEGLEKETANAVWAIPPAIVTREIVTPGTGSIRPPEQGFAAPTVGVLKFSVAFVPGAPSAIRQWCENSLFAGRQERRAGLLRYLGPSRNPNDEIARIGFVELLPYRFEIDKPDDGPWRLNVETSVRSMVLT